MPKKGELIKGSYFNCELCHKEFWRCNAWKNKWRPVYCSWKCRNLSMSPLANKIIQLRVVNLYKSDFSMAKISKIIKSDHVTIKKFLVEKGIKIRPRNFYNQGVKNHKYKGGYITKSGYKRISLFGKNIFEHRFIMQNFIKRKLSKNEHVHHLNGKKTDNRLENLAVYSPKKHGAFHAKEFNDFKRMYQHRINELENIIGRFKNTSY